MDLDDVRQGFLAAGIPEQLVDELLEAYVEAKRRFHLGDLRPNEVEGGRFSEAAFRVLQHVAGQRVTPVGRSLPGTDKLLPAFEAVTGQPDSVRLHIPRTLRLIYDIRNKRDAAHLGDGIDPNLQDASLVVANMDWVMAELVRLHHAVTADEAQAIIEDLVTKEIPAVQEIDGHPVILTPLQAQDRAMLMLYRAGAAGATVDELAAWLREGRKDHLRTRLRRLDREQLVLEHPQTGKFHITFNGERYVEERGLAQPL
jgi:ribosomal protein L19E